MIANRGDLAGISNLTVSFAPYDELLSIVESACGNIKGTLTLAYANSHTVVLSASRPDFHNCLTQFSVVYSDGIGMYRAAKLLYGNALQLQTIQNATEFNYLVIDFARRYGRKVYFLGGTNETLNRLTERARKEYEGMIIAGTKNGYAGIEDTTVVEEINLSQPDILMVGMGQPKQEEWVIRNAKLLHVPVVIVVGGFLDFFGETTRRAPVFLQRIGLEWLFRMLQEPGRLWKRYVLGIPHFCFMILRQKFNSESS